MPSKMKSGNKKMSKMPKDHYESTMKNIMTGGGKYSMDNVKELTSNSEKLSGYLKSNREHSY